MATTQEAVQISAIVPTLTVDDLQGASVFTKRSALRSTSDGKTKGRDRKKGIGVRLSIATTPGHVDEMARRARSAGITLLSEPHDTEWKSRAFEVTDPSGFLLTIFSEMSA